MSTSGQGFLCLSKVFDKRDRPRRHLVEEHGKGRCCLSSEQFRAVVAKWSERGARRTAQNLFHDEVMPTARLHASGLMVSVFITCPPMCWVLYGIPLAGGGHCWTSLMAQQGDADPRSGVLAMRAGRWTSVLKPCRVCRRRLRFKVSLTQLPFLEFMTGVS